MNHNIYRYLSILENINEVIKISEEMEKDDFSFVSKREALRIYNNAFIGLIKEGYPFFRQDDNSVTIEAFNKTYTNNYVYLKRHLGKELYILLPPLDNPLLNEETITEENVEENHLLDVQEEKDEKEDDDLTRNVNNCLKTSEFKSSIISNEIDSSFNLENENNTNDLSQLENNELSNSSFFVEENTNDNLESLKENEMISSSIPLKESQEIEQIEESEDDFYKNIQNIIDIVNDTMDEGLLENEEIYVDNSIDVEDFDDVVDLEDNVDNLEGLYFFDVNKDTSTESLKTETISNDNVSNNEIKKDSNEIKKESPILINNEENVLIEEIQNSINIKNSQDVLFANYDKINPEDLFKKENLFYDKHTCKYNNEEYEFYVFPNETKVRNFAPPIVAFSKYNGAYKMIITDEKSETKTVTFSFGNISFVIRGKWKKNKFISSILVNVADFNPNLFTDIKETFRPEGNYLETYPSITFEGHKFKLIPASTQNTSNGTADVFVVDEENPTNIFSPSHANILMISTSSYNFTLTAYWENDILKYDIV